MPAIARKPSDATAAFTRRYPVGAEILPGGGVHFRVWASGRRKVGVVLADGREYRLVPEGDGYFSGAVAGLGAGTLYRLRVNGQGPWPDPASRFQPDGPHGPSMVVDPQAYAWTDGLWRGRPIERQVLYEMHIGTFTPEGTWAAARIHLPALADTGVTVLEIMPVAEFAGRFGWGYDGVDLFAPTRLYGTPDDMRRFVDAAHRLGLAAILDVVYNHLGPSGNYLTRFSPDYFTDAYVNEWGDPINFDGPGSGPVREFFAANAAYWIDEFHLDGLRLDATQQMFDASERHILADIAAAVRQAADGRATILVAENEPQRVSLLRPAAQGGYGLDALWNDDFHHSAIVALTGRHEAYYGDYRGTPQEFVSAAKYGFLFQGQWCAWQGKTRGSPTSGVPPASFVNYLQNHDQIANSGRGERLDRLAASGAVRAMTALLLLLPGTPMLFQGQEFGASAPFLYFADHEADLADAVSAGRAAFLGQFPSLATAEARARLPAPQDAETFARCKLDHTERDRNPRVAALHRDLLRLRRDDPVFAAQGAGGLDGAVLAAEAFLLRFFGGQGDDRLLLVNLGRDLPLEPAPEPLLAPPPQRGWRLLWSSEDPAYGGSGTPQPPPGRPWRVPGRAAIVLAPEESSRER